MIMGGRAHTSNYLSLNLQSLNMTETIHQKLNRTESQSVARGIRYSGLGVRSVGPEVRDFLETRLCTKNTKEALHQQELLRLLAPHKHPTRVETMSTTHAFETVSWNQENDMFNVLAPRNTSPRRAWGLLHGFPTLSAPGIPWYFQKGKWIIASAEVMGQVTLLSWVFGSLQSRDFP